LDKNYKMEISISPNYKDNKYKPYYWVLYVLNNDTWCNEGFGWSYTPVTAWEDGYKFYTSFKCSGSFPE
jgi:hypothetical protein